MLKNNFMSNFKKIFNLLKLIRSILFREKGIVSKRYISRFFNDNPVIVEAGAHIGTDTCEMAKLWPQAMIYAFEPLPELFSQLKKNTSSFPNVKCFEMALGDKTGTCNIYQSSGESDGSSSILEPKEHLKNHPNVIFEQRIEVEVITLNDWIKKYNVDKVDFLWLDLQGFELNVLKESKEIISKVSVIYTEVSIIENYSKSALYPELRDWLKEKGFKVKKKKIAWKDGGNVLFVRI